MGNKNAFLGKEEPQPPSSDWKQKAYFNLFAVGAVREEGEGLVPSSVLESLIQKGADLMSATDGKVMEKAQEIMQELQINLQGYEALIVLAIMRHLTQAPDLVDRIGPELSEKLSCMVEQADQEKQKGDLGCLNHVLNEGWELFNEIVEKLNEGAMTRNTNLLQDLIMKKKK